MGIVIPAMVTVLVTDRYEQEDPHRKEMLIQLSGISCSDHCRGDIELALVMGRSGGTFQDRFFKHVEIQVGQQYPDERDFYKGLCRLDWKYLPQWFGLTTPVIYLLLGIIGFIFLIIRFFRKPLDFIGQTNDRNQLIYLAVLRVLL